MCIQFLKLKWDLEIVIDEESQQQKYVHGVFETNLLASLKDMFTSIGYCFSFHCNYNTY